MWPVWRHEGKTGRCSSASRQLSQIPHLHPLICSAVSGDTGISVCVGQQSLWFLSPDKSPRKKNLDSQMKKWWLRVQGGKVAAMLKEHHCSTPSSQIRCCQQCHVWRRSQIIPTLIRLSVLQTRSTPWLWRKTSKNHLDCLFCSQQIQGQQKNKIHLRGSVLFFFFLFFHSFSLWAWFWSIAAAWATARQN